MKIYFNNFFLFLNYVNNFYNIYQIFIFFDGLASSESWSSDSIFC